jgi:hypothetical protein
MELNLLPGDKVWMIFSASYESIAPDGSTVRKFTFKYNSGTVSFGNTTHFNQTPAKLYLINEALSRCIEAYTNDGLRLKSDYFGRLDSQPYTSDQIGCGALEAVTNGLLIRAKDADTINIGGEEVTPLMTVSMKELFEGVHALHNLGIGPEPDTVRGGDYQWLRIEPISYYYKNDILLTCDGVDKLDKGIDLERLFAAAKFGYNNWETENINGLNDVFSKREYRTALKEITGTYNQASNIIASDYAIEVTRRQFAGTTKDWKYDNSIFIVCITDKLRISAFFGHSDVLDDSLSFTSETKPYGLFNVGDSIQVTGTAHNDGTYTVSAVNENPSGVVVLFSTTFTAEGPVEATFVNLTTPFKLVEVDIVENSDKLLLPEQCYNLRITPARNAIRHLKHVLAAFVDYTKGKLFFTNGEGNCIAQIDLDDDDCLNETGMLAENQALSASTLTDPTKAKPIWKPELVKFNYPLTWEQYLQIKANPYGLIGYSYGTQATQYGWIQDFQYKPAEGMADFTLISKYPD